MTCFSFCNCIIIVIVVVVIIITRNYEILLIIVCLIIFLGEQICNLCGKKIDYQYQIIFLIILVNHCWAMIDITFCFFCKVSSYGMSMFWFSIFLRMYWDKKCIQKERSWSYFVYFKEINWFGIKDNIKIEVTSWSFLNGGKTLFFSFLSN